MPSPPVRPDSAGVRFPPPLLYVAMLLVGLALQRVCPITPLPPAFARGVGLVCVLAWAVLMTWGVILFARARTSLDPGRPARTLLTQGPFRLTRNPLYVSLLLLYLGISLWLDAFWPLVLSVPLVLLVNRLVIVREERYLERAFGDDYRKYKARIRRWI